MSRVTAVAPVLAIGTVATMLAGGCSAGQNTQTADQPSTIQGVNQTIQMMNGTEIVGEIALRDLMAQYQQGGYQAGANVPLIVRVFNNGLGPVKLCAVTTSLGEVGKTSAAPAAPAAPAASASASAAPTGATASTSPSVDADNAAQPTTEANAQASAQATPTAAASTTPARTTASPATAPTSVATPATGTAGCPLNMDIPTNGYRMLLPGMGEYLQVTKIGQALQPGASFSVAFQFTDAQGKQWATEEFQIPVAMPTSPLPRASSDIEEEH